MEYLQNLSINEFSMATIRETGVEKAFAQAMETLAADTDYLFLTLDLDAFDPADAPSVGTPAAGGFTREEMLPVLREIAAQYDFAGIEITEYNPTLDGRDRTRALIFDLLAALLPVRQTV